MRYQTVEMRTCNGTFNKHWEDTEQEPEGRGMLRVLFPFAIYGFALVVFRWVWIQKLSLVYFEEVQESKLYVQF